jgi:3-demethoxyubiquinol 3-hydroxylase
MLHQEQKHLRYFNDLVKEFHARPTALMPFWNMAGWTLGVGTALMGREAAMACTEAVETVVGGHYNDQLRTLATLQLEDKGQLGSSTETGPSADCDFSLPIEPLAVQQPPEISTDFETFRAIIKECRDEELEHLDTAVEQDAMKAPFYAVLSGLIRSGCSMAISAAKVL